MLVPFEAYPSGDRIAICPEYVVSVEELRDGSKRIAVIFLMNNTRYAVRDRARDAIAKISRAIEGDDDPSESWRGN